VILFHTAVSRRPAASARRRALLRAGFSAAMLFATFAAIAQNRGRQPRVGFLAPDSLDTGVHEGFRQGMTELGRVEGRDVVIEWRFADGNYARLPELASDLTRQNLDVVVAVTTLCVQAMRQVASGVPIVMVAVPDPVGEGFAASLARPGGNITGLSNIVTEVSTKHLELLRVAVPRLARVGVLINPLNPSDALVLEQIHGAAYTSGVKVLPVEASTARQIDDGFAAMARARVEGLIVAVDAYFDVQKQQIVKLALEGRLPTISSNRDITAAGGLMSYGQDMAAHYRRAASYVDKLMKGVAAATLPIERPTVLEFVINQRTANALDLAIPRELMLRADRVIE
jgi:putative ABC transport system substrate-binding protein